MDGLIKSYVAEKQYGFITGSDKKNYFFHISAFSSKEECPEIKDNMLVKFDPIPTPKGLKAIKLSTIDNQSVLWVQPDKFVISKSDKPKNGVILFQTPVIKCESDDSPNSAKQLLISKAANLGANGLLNFTYSKSTGASGNYQYTVHHYSGAAAIIVEQKFSCDLSKIAECNADNEQLVDRLKNSYLNFLTLLDAEEKIARRKRMMFFILILAAITFYLFTNS